MIASMLKNWSLVSCKARRCVRDSYGKLCSECRSYMFVLVFPLHLAIKESNLFNRSALGFSPVFSEGPEFPT